MNAPRRWPNSWLSARSRPGRRAVVGQEHRGAAVRADVDRARDELLAGAALAGDEHGEVVALQPLNLLDDARHRGAGGEKSGQQRLERPIDGGSGAARPSGRARRRARTLPRHGGDHAQAPHDRVADRPRRGDQREARAFGVAAERLDDERRRGRTACPCSADARERRAPCPRRSRRTAMTRTSPPASCTNTTARVGRRGFEQGRGRLASEQIRQRRRIHDPPHDRIVGVGGRDDVLAGADRWSAARAPPRVSARSRSAPSCSKTADGLVEMALGDRARAGLGDEAAEREMAERGLIALAEQIEQRRALREVVVRVGRRAVLRVQRAAQPQVLAPRRRRDASGSSASAAAASRCSASGEPAGGDQRFGGDERRLQRVERRRAGLRGSRRRARRPRRARRAGAPAGRRARAPTTRTSGSSAGRRRRTPRRRAPRNSLGDVVAAAHQVNLRQRVEDGAGRLVELNRAADVERAVQRLLGARRDRRAARRSVRAWPARRRGRGPTRALRAAPRCARPARAPARSGARASSRWPGCRTPSPARRRPARARRAARPGGARAIASS